MTLNNYTTGVVAPSPANLAFYFYRRGFLQLPVARCLSAFVEN